MTYTPVKVSVDEKQNKKMKNAIKEKKPLTLKVIFGNLEKNTVLFTPSQVKKIERAQLIGKNCVSIRMSKKQVQSNVEHKGGFLWGLVSRLAPAIIGGIASGLASKAVSGKGIYFQKKNICAKVEPVKGGGLYLSPHPNFVEGEGLLLGENSPFKNIPLLGLLL